MTLKAPELRDLRLDRLEYELGLPPITEDWAPPVEPPVEPLHRVLIGASVDTVPSWPQNWARLEAAIGMLQAVRLFDSAEATSPATLFRNVAGKGLEIHSSTKSLSADVAKRRTYYEAVKATGEKVVAYTFHEPDDNMAGKSSPVFSYATWRAAALTDARICRDLKIDYGICWQLYAYWGWPELIDQLVFDAELLELTTVMGWDTYQRGNTAYRQAEYRPWSYNGNVISELMARMPDHLQVVLPEFGVPEHPTDEDYRMTYLVDMHAQAVREKWRTVLTYNAFKIPDDPGDNWVSTGPEFLYDTPECRPESRATMAAIVEAGHEPL